jgi:hypothetical protein
MNIILCACMALEHSFKWPPLIKKCWRIAE